MRSHEVMDKDHLICDECGMKLKSKSSLYNHRHMVHNHKVFECSLCSKVFASFYSINAMYIAWANLHYDCIWGVPEGESLKRKTLLYNAHARI